MIPYATQSINANDLKNVKKTLKNKFLTQGPLNKKFENNLSKKFNSKYCLTVNSGTSALHLACISLGLKKNDLVLTSPVSFVATANAVIYTGAKVDFVDINESFNIDPNQLEKKILFYKKKYKIIPKAVIVVHLAGLPTGLSEVWKLSKKYKFKIIEDASHAVGAKYKNKYIGGCQYSHITTFSFHPVKIITTSEGGALLTNIKNLYDNALYARSHGIKRKKNSNKFWIYDQKRIGWNFRMSEIQAALGISQLSRIKSFTDIRIKISKKYKDNLRDLPIKFQKIDKNSQSSWHLFIIIVNQKYRDNLFYYLKQKKIETNLHYIPIYRHSFHKNKEIKYYKNEYRKTEEYFKQAISLPMHANLSNKQLNYIINSIKKFFKENYAPK